MLLAIIVMQFYPMPDSKHREILEELKKRSKNTDPASSISSHDAD